MTGIITRSFQLDDIQIRSGGDGRTVEAYAAVFDRAVEIHDAEGHYLEEIDPTAFNRTISHKGTRFGVFYNHAKTIYGTPSERYSIPLGTPLEVRADSRGLLTVTRYNKTPLADEILAAIQNGDIRGQSFQGRFTRSTPDVPRGGFRPGKDGALRTVRRMEIDMREYGPTPFPAYEDAAIIGVRSLLEQFTDLSEEERAELARHLTTVTPIPDPTANGTPPNDGPAADDPPAPAEHSNRHDLNRLRVLARKKGVI